jgi:hypothetical protein
VKTVLSQQLALRYLLSAMPQANQPSYTAAKAMYDSVLQLLNAFQVFVTLSLLAQPSPCRQVLLLRF